MKKLLFITIITAFAAVNSYGQYDICYDINCIFTPSCTTPFTPPGCPPSPVPPFTAIPPYNCPQVCRYTVIENQLDCDLDFWWDYTGTAPCGDIVPAYWDCPWLGYGYCLPAVPPVWPSGIPFYAHVVQSGVTRTLVAYELIWPNCQDPACSCPNSFHWRMDVNLYNNTTAPFQPDLFGAASFTFLSISGTITKYQANYLDCSNKTFYIYHDSATDTYTFSYL